MHADEDTVGPGEGIAVLLEGGHVRMTLRYQLVEARVEAGTERGHAQAQGQQKKQQAQRHAPGDQPAGESGDQCLKAGHGSCSGHRRTSSVEPGS
ncbi:hypothetical protein D3C80_1245100 [compost metagenome]